MTLPVPDFSASVVVVVSFSVVVVVVVEVVVVVVGSVVSVDDVWSDESVVVDWSPVVVSVVVDPSSDATVWAPLTA